MTEPIFDHDRLDSAFQCAAIQDVLVASSGVDDVASREWKSKLKRIVAMLTKMAMKFDGVREPSGNYIVAIDYQHEHRDAEHEHEREPELE